MLQEVRIMNYRGLKDTTIPLAPVTLITGTNGVGKTSVLEGLYFLLSPQKPDAAVFTRYPKLLMQTNMAAARGFTIPDSLIGYDYFSFWKECPSDGEYSCRVEAILYNTFKMSCEMKLSDFSVLEQEMKNNATVYGLQGGFGVPYILWEWRYMGKNEKFTKVIETELGIDSLFAKYCIKKVQQLSMEPRFSPTIGTGHINTECRYIDMSSVRYIPDNLPFQTENLLTDALKIINPNVTGIRHDAILGRLRVIINNKSEYALGTLGSGAESLASVLLMLSELLSVDERRNLLQVFLADEIGAGIHYSKLEEMWSFLCKLFCKYPNLQMVLTTHSQDCIDAFCKTFLNAEPGMAHIVRLHKFDEIDGVKTTLYPHEMFESIFSGEWEIRG